MVELIIELFLCIMDVLIFYIFSSYFLDKEVKITNKKELSVLILLIITIFLITNLSLFQNFSTILSLIAIVFFFSFLYRMDIHMVFEFTLIYVCIGIITVFIVNLVNLIPFMTQEMIMNNNAFKVLIFISSRGIMLLLVIRLGKHKFKDNPLNIKKFVLLFIIFLLFNIIFISILFYASYIIDTELVNYILILGLVFLVLDVILMISFYFHLNKLSYEKSELQIKYNMEVMSKINVDIIKQASESIKQLNHDYKYLVTSIGYLTENKKYDELSELIKDTQITKKCVNIVNSGNLIIDSIMNSYIQKYPNIEFSCQIFISNIIKISSMDLCAIIGNLISNATEATNKADCDKIIKILIKEVHSNLVIDLQNPYSENYSSIDFFTTKRYKEEHGYGTKSIQNIIKKYDGYMNKTFEDNICHQSLLLKLKTQ